MIECFKTENYLDNQNTDEAYLATLKNAVEKMSYSPLRI